MEELEVFSDIFLTEGILDTIVVVVVGIEVYFFIEGLLNIEIICGLFFVKYLVMGETV